MAKRVYYYLIGFTIGAVFIYFLLLKGKSFDFWLPGERVKQELIERKPLFPEKAVCQFQCLQLNKDSIHSLIKESKVNFDRSRVHEKPCRYYVLENAEEKSEMEFSVCDTVATLLYIKKAGQECSCD